MCIFSTFLRCTTRYSSKQIKLGWMSLNDVIVCSLHLCQCHDNVILSNIVMSSVLFHKEIYTRRSSAILTAAKRRCSTANTAARSDVLADIVEVIFCNCFCCVACSSRWVAMRASELSYSLCSCRHDFSSKSAWSLVPRRCCFASNKALFVAASSADFSCSSFRTFSSCAFASISSLACSTLCCSWDIIACFIFSWVSFSSSYPDKTNQNNYQVGHKVHKCCTSCHDHTSHTTLITPCNYGKPQEICIFSTWFIIFPLLRPWCFSKQILHITGYHWII